MARTTIDEGRSRKAWTYLTPTEGDQLQAFADAIGVTVSTVIRSLVRRMLDDENEFHTAERLPARERLTVAREPAQVNYAPETTWAQNGCTHSERTMGDGVTACYVCNPSVVRSVVPLHPAEPVTTALPPGSDWAGRGFLAVPLPPWAVPVHDPLDYPDPPDSAA